MGQVILCLNKSTGRRCDSSIAISRSSMLSSSLSFPLDNIVDSNLEKYFCSPVKTWQAQSPLAANLVQSKTELAAREPGSGCAASQLASRSRSSRLPRLSSVPSICESRKHRDRLRTGESTREECLRWD